MSNAKKTFKFIDVNNRSELPKLSSKYRYIDFLGGTKEVRCFIAPVELARCVFIQKYEYLIDEAFHAIYENDLICVRQDTSYPLPGFYIVSLSKQLTAFDYMDDILFLRFSFIIKRIRSIMRKVLNIKHVHLHYEEKPDPSCNVHFWLVPIDTVPILYTGNIRKSFAALSFKKNRDNILKTNQKMTDHIIKVDLKGEDMFLNKILQKWR